MKNKKTYSFLINTKKKIHGNKYHQLLYVFV